MTGALQFMLGFSWVTFQQYDDTRATVIDSLLFGQGGVGVGASASASRGVVTLVNATLRAPGNAIFVVSGCAGSGTGYCGGSGANGDIKVVKSTLDAASGLMDVETHSNGNTLVLNTDIIAGTKIVHASPIAGTCFSMTTACQ